MSDAARSKRYQTRSPRLGWPQQDWRAFARDVIHISRTTVVSVSMLTTAVVAGGLVGLDLSFRRLPDVQLLENYTPIETSYIYDMNGTTLASIHDEANRKVVALDEISPHLKRAVLAIEDSSFYSHQGVNPSSVARAFLRNAEQGETVEGASTLTMQLVKNLFLTPEQTLSRKIAEAVLSVRIEQVFDKNKVLELYLNQVYWGHNAYGVETAARSYFDKSATELNLAEAAMMAGLIQAPEAYSPFIDYELAKERQAIVLRRMRVLNWITAEEEAAAKETDIKLGEITSFASSKSPYVTDAVVQEMTQRFGRATLLQGGMRVQTSIDFVMQTQAELLAKQVHWDLNEQGYSVDQLAMVAIEPKTHFIKTVVGGVDYRHSQFNRAMQASRQTGSSFKPFVYYAALASGRYEPQSMIDDAAVSYPDGGSMYTPRNYDGEFWGPITLTTALAHSRNIPAIRLGQEVGLDQIIEICRVLGFKSPMQPVPSMPLGALEVTPLEMANAFATFASEGWYADPSLIVQVTNREGELLLQNVPTPRLVLDPVATRKLTTMLEAVINEGSGTLAALDRPAAGKTGTTDSARDVWFVGYVPELAAAVWLGNDDNYPLGYEATGGDLAAPVWQAFMMQALSRSQPVSNGGYMGGDPVVAPAAEPIAPTGFPSESADPGLEGGRPGESPADPVAPIAPAFPSSPGAVDAAPSGEFDDIRG